MLYVALGLLVAFVVADLVLGIRRERRLLERLESLERVGLLVTPDPKHKDAPVPMRMSPRQKVRYIEQKLRKRAENRGGA